ncbi:hypothetical protein SmJEL517_g02620 [Synchytrium microbalum]|uniref:G-protein coupled receptors family 2 profile 2 domain-containing protein n=1 Tax=Synchytrium microbalum TaxID=1806994 RepID=A0A507C728_9FUNG|nr:uncharacterized protein SmJEL517_g02620 [Synchytrium microbalum]TPX34929.1 hypothetical protein SmJEL517_g02620 [Synchytrium microbalum]
MGFSDPQLMSLHVTVQITSLLSLIASSVVIYHILFKNPRKDHNRITLLLAVSDFFTSLATVFAQYPVNGALSNTDGTASSICIAQGWAIQTFYIASALWNSAMAVNVLLVLSFRYSIDDLPKLDLMYSAIIFSVTLITSSVLAAVGAYGDATLWCWIVPSRSDLRIGVFYIPLIIMFLFDLAIYIQIGVTLWNSQRKIRNSVGIVPSPLSTRVGRTSTNGSDDIRDPVARFVSKVALFICGFFVILAPASLNRILNLAGITSFGFFYAQALTQPLSGVVTFAVYFSRRGGGAPANSGSSDTMSHRQTGEIKRANSNYELHRSTSTFYAPERMGSVALNGSHQSLVA